MVEPNNFYDTSFSMLDTSNNTFDNNLESVFSDYYQQKDLFKKKTTNIKDENELRFGENSRNTNKEFKKNMESIQIDRFQILDKDPSKRPSELEFPRGGETTRLKKSEVSNSKKVEKITYE